MFVMHLPILLLALTTTLAPAGEPPAACARDAADLFAVLDCEQPVTVVAVPEQPPGSLDAEDEEDAGETRRRAERTPPASQADFATAAPLLPLPSPHVRRAEQRVPPPRREPLAVAIPRARAQLPDPPPST
jgi:hypothetical protein